MCAEAPVPSVFTRPRVVGIEICKPATYDAEVNAALNIVKNVTFVNSKATDAMEDLLRKKREDNEKHLIRVVGPPSAGLHHLGIPRSLSKVRIRVQSEVKGNLKTITLE
ncbi:hypothetical protein DVH05_022316 [Phytophthora capsici]|nr:hypothetical protein DVH05_022316 [Phytophthora capsici]